MTRLAAEIDQAFGKHYDQEVRSVLAEVSRDRGNEAEKKRERGVDR